MTPRELQHPARHCRTPSSRGSVPSYDRIATGRHQKVVCAAYGQILIRSAGPNVNRAAPTIPSSNQILATDQRARRRVHCRVGEAFLSWVHCPRFRNRNRKNRPTSRDRDRRGASLARKPGQIASLSAISRASLVLTKQQLGWHTSRNARCEPQNDGSRANTSRQWKCSAP